MAIIVIIYNIFVLFCVHRAKDEMPVDEAGLFSFTFITWITNLMWKAYKTGLKDDDVPLCSKYDMCEYNTDR